MGFDKKQRRTKLNIVSFDEKSERRNKWNEKRNHREKDRFKNKSQAQTSQDKEIGLDSEDFGQYSNGDDELDK